jgi:RNA polymerase sigma factor (sigma-70 family)
VPLTENEKRKVFTEIYSDNYLIVFSAIYIRVANTDDAKDICQEVFFRFYQKLNEVENVSRWLFTALKLVVMEYYRRKGKDNVNIDDVLNDVGMTFINGFKDTRIIINEAIGEMSDVIDENEKIIFNLIAVHNFSYGETAREIGITRRQVEYRYTQMVKRILKYLEGKGIQRLEDLL